MTDEPAVAPAEPVVAAEPAAAEPAVAPVEPAPEPTPGIAVPTPGIAAAIPAPDPNIPEAYQTDDGTADITKLVERAKAADAAASDDLPTDAAGYDLKLAEAPKLFNGQAVEFSADDPQIKAALEKMHSLGIGQSDASELLGMYANAMAGNMNGSAEAMQAAVDAEKTKLGENPEAQEARIGALMQSVGVALGDEKRAHELLNEVRSFRGFEAIETLMGKLNGMGGERSPVSNGAISGQKTLAERMNAPD